MRHSFPEGTIGHWLEHGGSSLRGLSVTSETTSLVLQQTQLTWRQVLPNSSLVAYGITLEITHGEQKETIDLEQCDHLGNIRQLLHKKVEFHESAIRDQLLTWATAYEQHFASQSTDPISWVLNSTNELPKLLIHLLQKPNPNSLVAWADKALTAASFAPIVTTYKGHQITLAVRTYEPPSPALGGMASTLGFSVNIDPHREIDSWGDPWMYLGFIDDVWLERRGPSSAEELAYVDLLLQKWHEDTTRYVERSLKKDGFACLSGMHWQFDMPTFWIFDLLTHYLEHGPPPPVPVPAFTNADIKRAAGILKRASDEMKQNVLQTYDKATSRPIAMYDLQGYTLVLADDITRPIPFYAFSILLRSPGSSNFVTILMNDVWNPQAACVIDGDVFALRRLIEWLRGAIKKNKLNERITFEGEDEDSEKIQKTSLWVTDWLLLGQPEPNEELLVDWRCQRYIASPGADNGILCFAGIYGFTPEYQKRIADEDIPIWRRFLREVIDPRFA